MKMSVDGLVAQLLRTPSELTKEELAFTLALAAQAAALAVKLDLNLNSLTIITRFASSDHESQFTFGANPQ